MVSEGNGIILFYIYLPEKMISGHMIHQQAVEPPALQVRIHIKVMDKGKEGEKHKLSKAAMNAVVQW